MSLISPKLAKWIDSMTRAMVDSKHCRTANVTVSEHTVNGDRWGLLLDLSGTYIDVSDNETLFEIRRHALDDEVDEYMEGRDAVLRYMISGMIDAVIKGIREGN